MIVWSPRVGWLYRAYRLQIAVFIVVAHCSKPGTWAPQGEKQLVSKVEDK